MKELVIDRSKWLRGEQVSSKSKICNPSMLHRPSDGKMCCLGLYLESCGMPKEHLTSVATPLALAYPVPAAAAWLQDSMDYGHVAAMMMVNDESVLSEAEREARLTPLFAERGVAVTFIDGPAPQ